MHVKRFADAKPYDAPNHRNYTSLRMFGAEAGGTKGLVFGYSHFLPGGGAGPDASPPDRCRRSESAPPVRAWPRRKHRADPSSLSLP